jgi:hypothetical protein
MDASTLQKVSNALCVPEEMIKNFMQESAIHVFLNTYHDHATLV